MPLGLHCAEERYQEDVCNEVHEQTEMCGAQRSEECLQGTPDHARSGAPFPGEFVVSAFMGSLNGAIPTFTPKHWSVNPSGFPGVHVQNLQLGFSRKALVLLGFFDFK